MTHCNFRSLLKPLTSWEREQALLQKVGRHQFKIALIIRAAPLPYKTRALISNYSLFI